MLQELLTARLLYKHSGVTAATGNRLHVASVLEISSADRGQQKELDISTILVMALNNMSYEK